MRAKVRVRACLRACVTLRVRAWLRARAFIVYTRIRQPIARASLQIQQLRKPLIGAPECRKCVSLWARDARSDFPGRGTSG